MAAARETLTYELFGQAVRDLAQLVVDDGFEPDIVLSIARGGLLLGGALGYALDVKNIFVMNVEFYTGVDERLELPVVLPPTPDVVDLTGATVLVADDVADTGATLKLVRDFCAGHVAEVRCAVIYEKPQSLVHSEYVWRRTDRWINFPWSTLPPVRRRENSIGHGARILPAPPQRQRPSTRGLPAPDGCRQQGRTGSAGRWNWCPPPRVRTPTSS